MLSIQKVILSENQIYKTNALNLILFIMVIGGFLSVDPKYPDMLIS